MPKESEHIPHAQHNIDFLKTFYNNSEYIDWFVTVCFYVSVHIIEAIIFKVEKIKIKDKEYELNHSDELQSRINGDIRLSPHLSRKMIVDYNFSEISNYYYSLYNRSHTARYLKYSFTKEDVTYVLHRCLNQIILWAKDKYGMSFDMGEMS